MIARFYSGVMRGTVILMWFLYVICQGKVVVIRGEGPKGGPGMPEMLTPTSAIMGAGLGKVYQYKI